MKILGLGSSDVHGGKGNIPAEELYPNAMAPALAKAIGEPVELIARALWPNPGTNLVVRRWLEELEPDLVVYAVSSFWFLYESTPVRIERRFGTPGRFISQQSQRIAATPWLAHNRVFQWGRKQTQRTLGGRAWFEPGDVIARSTEIIREVIQREGHYLVVVGPGSGDRWALNEAHRERLAARSDTVDTALAAICRGHHVHYTSSRSLASLQDPEGLSLQGDQLHLDREGHRRAAQRYFEVVLGWVQLAAAARETDEELRSRIAAENAPL